MNINDILQEESLLLESGVRIPEGTKSVKILHHDDFDGVMSAVAMGLQLSKQGIKPDKITTDILHDRDEGVDQIKKLAKRKGQMLVVVDFDRFKDAAKEIAKKDIDAQTDHHETDRKKGENTSANAIKTEFDSDIMHISTKKAQGFIEGSSLSIMNGIDSAQFQGNLTTNIDLQRRLKENDGAKNKNMRLAIITSSVLGQLVRSKASVNKGAVQSIVREVMKKPSVMGFYNAVKEHVDLAKEQVELINAYEGKKNDEVDWEAIKKYNEKAPKEMRIATDKRTGTVRKKDIGRSALSGKAQAPSSEEEMAAANAKKDKEEMITKPDGSKELIAKDVGDADLKPWELKDKYKSVPQKKKSEAWKAAEEQAKKKAKDKWPEDKEGQKKLIVPIWKKKMNELQKGAPGIKKKTENVAVSDKFGANRYMPYQDPKVASAIRDFGKFWQMAMSPDYYDRFKKAAEKKGKTFNPEEIDLVTLGKESMKEVADRLLTAENLRKKGFENPEALAKDLKDAFDADLAKSGGHKAITNIGMENLFSRTADKYKELAKRAKKLSSPKSEKLKKRFDELARKFESFFKYEFKREIQDTLAKKVQDRINNTKDSLRKTLKASISKYAGIPINEDYQVIINYDDLNDLNESNRKRREWKKNLKAYGSKEMADAIDKSSKKLEKVKIVEDPIKYAKSNKDFLKAVRKFYRKGEMKPEEIEEKFFYYDKNDGTVSPGSWDESVSSTIGDILKESF